jgi:hypothetical protein
VTKRVIRALKIARATYTLRFGNAARIRGSRQQRCFRLPSGLGQYCTIFLVNAILLKQLAVPSASQLVVLRNASDLLILSYRQLNELNRDATETSGLFGTHPIDVSVMLGNQPQWISAELVTGEYFHTLQVKAARGRLLSQRDLEDAEGNPTCVISYQLWMSHFRGADDVIGRTILLNTRLYKIIGVSERGFIGPDLQR